MHGFVYLALIPAGILVSCIIGLVAGSAKGAGVGLAWLFGTLIFFFVIFPHGIEFVDYLSKKALEKQVQLVKREHSRLCSSRSREVKKRTVDSVSSVGIWPAQGPRTRSKWGDDFFGLKDGLGYLTSKSFARKIAYQEAKVSPLERSTDSLPRYQVVLDSAPILGVEDASFHLGIRVRIFDIQAGELLAERTDYQSQIETTIYAVSCDPSWQRHLVSLPERNLAFIESVLIPKPDRSIVESEVIRIVEPDQVPESEMWRAQLLRDEETSQKYSSGDASLRDGVVYESRYSGAHKSPTTPHQALRFQLADRENVAIMEDRRGLYLIAFSEDAGEYVGVFRVEHRNFIFLLLRYFSKEGQFLRERWVSMEALLPDIYTILPGGRLEVRNSNEYRFTALYSKRNSDRLRRFEVGVPKSNASPQRRVQVQH